MSSEPRQLPRHRPSNEELERANVGIGPHRDGRLERRRRNRNAVLDAYIELTERGSSDPTMEQMAEIAGVSHRSVFRYFDDRSALVLAAADRTMERLGSLMFVEPRSEQSFATRVDDFVSARTRAYESLGPHSGSGLRPV